MSIGRQCDGCARLRRNQGSSPIHKHRRKRLDAEIDGAVRRGDALHRFPGTANAVAIDRIIRFRAEIFPVGEDRSDRGNRPPRPVQAAKSLTQCIERRCFLTSPSRSISTPASIVWIATMIRASFRCRSAPVRIGRNFGALAGWETVERAASCDRAVGLYRFALCQRCGVRIRADSEDEGRRELVVDGSGLKLIFGVPAGDRTQSALEIAIREQHPLARWQPGYFPGLCAGASLKLGEHRCHSVMGLGISPALCRGLIEAATAVIVGLHAIPDFSRHMRSRVSSVIVGSHP
jgi:hypothetical protein